MRSMAFLPAAFVAATLLGGCASDATMDAKFASGWRPTAADCVFGGQTRQINAYCARQRGGYEAEVTAINASVQWLRGTGERCTVYADHVQQEAAATDPDLKFDRVYTCPDGVGPGVLCHVSAMLTDPEGKQWVLDNTYVVNQGIGVSGVATFDEFKKQVHQTYWVNKLPTVREAIALISSND